jgi:hypothetical protein
MATDLSNKVELNELRSEINDALNKICERRGLGMRLGNCTFDRDGTGCTFKAVEFYQLGEEGAVEMTLEARAFLRYAAMYSNQYLKEADLGTHFTFDGDIYTITGLKTRARKRPITARGPNGKAYVFSADVVSSALGRKTRG